MFAFPEHYRLLRDGSCSYGNVPNGFYGSKIEYLIERLDPIPAKNYIYTWTLRTVIIALVAAPIQVHHSSIYFPWFIVLSQAILNLCS